MKRLSLLASTALTIMFTSPASANPLYATEQILSGLEYPWGMDILPDGRMLITERAGRMRVVERDGTLLEDSVSGLPDVWVNGQGGLFDVKVGPDYDLTSHIYWTYACGTSQNSSTCMARGVLNESLSGSLSLSAVEEIFRSSPGRAGNAHYGGRFEFLADETIVLGLGDGFDYREEAQKPQNHLGSVVRFTLDGSVPTDNPFIGLSQADPYTYSFGHRNVQGLVFDAQRNRLYSTDHGPRGGDELNIMRAGANYGWPLITAGIDYNYTRISPFTSLPGMTPPLLEWTPSIAPSGLSQYHGDAFPQWHGDLFVSALAKQKVVRVRFERHHVTEQEDLFTELKRRIRYVYVATDGLLYLLTDYADGAVIRVQPAGDQ